MTESEEQRDLIDRAVAGDLPALERLLLIHYRKLSRRVEAKLPATLRSTVSVEDVLQEAFVHVFRDIGSFRPTGDGSFSAWLWSVTENRLRDTIKSLKRKKRGGGFRRVADQQADSMADLAEVLSAGSHTPSQSMARREAIQAVQVAIAGLPEDYQQAVHLRYLEGKSLDDVADTMQRSPAAIRGLLGRARKKMRAALGRSSLYLSGR